MCAHVRSCPPATADDRVLAVPVSRHPEQGWTLLCNGVVVFDDTGVLLPDGTAVDPRRPAVSRPAATRQDNREVRALIARIGAAQAAGRSLGLYHTRHRTARWFNFAG